MNGNGQLGIKYWQCKIWDGDDYVEETPTCANPLPEDVPEFNLCASCFVTTYFCGFKSQFIEFKKCKLFRYILDNYKPHIYVSEWTSGRMDCSCVYKLQCGFLGDNGSLFTEIKPFISYYKMQWDVGKWEKMQLLVTDYPDGMEAITFENEGCNTQSWKGHFGVKMAGGLIKFDFQSIEPLPIDQEGKFVSKQFKKVQYFANGLPKEDVIDYFQLDWIWNDDNDEIYYFMP
ncbi:hypothetical protein FQR65_LT09730 [Abscondita terminalis]|nr:hypothetical protein FQR65_LT09730 [Abscondita terminalis]